MWCERWNGRLWSMVEVAKLHLDGHPGLHRWRQRNYTGTADVNSMQAACTPHIGLGHMGRKPLRENPGWAAGGAAANSTNQQYQHN